MTPEVSSGGVYGKVFAMKEIFLVVPTIRNLSFLKEWGNQFVDCSLLVIEDHAERRIDTPKKKFKHIYHYCWADIRKDFAQDEWIFSRRNAGIRSYGFWKAYKLGADIIITLDDDCYPAEKDFVRKHLDNLESYAPGSWFPTFPHPRYMFTRGFPYGVRNKKRVVISHGLWSGRMDLDAKTELILGEVNVSPYPSVRQFIPSGCYFPMSSMNLAFSREAIPLMYFPLMGNSPKGMRWGYDRYDDIWSGIVLKKIVDHLGLSIVNGSPFVEHRKASDPAKNLEKERKGMKVNERLWTAVDRVHLVSRSPASAYRELAKKIIFPKGEYFVALRHAMMLWGRLF